MNYFFTDASRRKVRPGGFSTGTALVLALLIQRAHDSARAKPATLDVLYLAEERDSSARLVILR